MYRFGAPEQPPEEYEKEFSDVEDVDDDDYPKGSVVPINPEITDRETWGSTWERRGLCRVRNQHSILRSEMNKQWKLEITYQTSIADDFEYHKISELHNSHSECVSAIAEIKKLYNRIGHSMIHASVNKVGNADYLAEYIPLH